MSTTPLLRTSPANSVSAASSQPILGRDPATGRGIVVTADDGLIQSIAFLEHGEQRWLSAGFVDLQVNGYAGHDLNGLMLDVATVRSLCVALLKVGVTTFLPTLITAPEVRVVAALRMILEACAAPRRGRDGRRRPCRRPAHRPQGRRAAERTPGRDICGRSCWRVSTGCLR